MHDRMPRYSRRSRVVQFKSRYTGDGPTNTILPLTVTTYSGAVFSTIVRASS